MKKAKHIFGHHAVLSLLQHAPQHINIVYLQAKKTDQHINEIINLAKQANVQISYSERDELTNMIGDANHQGVIAAVTRTSYFSESDLWPILDDATTPILLLILDGVQDPHNLGACMRTANAAGAHAVIAPKDRAVGLTPVVCKVASGAAEVTPFIQVSNLARTIAQLKERGVWIYGAVEDAEQNIFKTDLKGNTALVFGAEGTGLRRLTREHCDFTVKIPMVGTVQNLNVSVAAAICLFEVVRQRI